MQAKAETQDILSEDFFEVIIVGGGTCGLAAAARLCEHTPSSIFTEDEHQRFHWLRKRGARSGVIKKDRYDADYQSQSRFTARDMLVLDAAADRFLAQWDSQFCSCQIPVLRSPMFFHPDPANIDGMISYAHQEKREKELMEIKNVVGKEYSKHQQKRVVQKRAKRCAAPLKGEHKSHDRDGVVDINMRDYRDYYRPATGLFRDFCRDIVARYGLESAVRRDEVATIRYGDVHLPDQAKIVAGFTVVTRSGRVYGARNCIVASGHRGKINYPLRGMAPAGLAAACHTTHIFDGAVSFPPPVLQRRLAAGQRASLVVVGGGLTSAQLAHIACTRGIHVTFVARGAIKIKHFDFHLDWVTKYKNIKKSSFYMLDTDEERLELIHASREGGSINPEYHKLLCKHEASGRLTIMRHTTVHRGEHDGRWQLELRTAPPGSDPQSHALAADYVCCATGIAPDIHGLDFMRDLMAAHPIDTVGGLPCLTDDLQWNADVPLYMVGKNASLRIGPTSANLDGARLGAERVGWKIQSDYSQAAPAGDARLELACGNTNWFSVLGEVQC